MKVDVTEHGTHAHTDQGKARLGPGKKVAGQNQQEALIRNRVIWHLHVELAASGCKKHICLQAMVSVAFYRSA